MTRTRKLQFAALLGGAAVALAGCSGQGAVAAGPSASPTWTDAQIQTVVNELVQCTRQNGAPGMPDVRVENGRAVLPDQSTVDQATLQNAKTAMDSCRSIRDRLPPSVFDDPSGPRDGGPGPQDVPAERRFSQCMREHGVPEFPDPQADGSYPNGSVLTTEGKSARMIAGFDACRQYYDGGFRTSS